jgi:peptidoglycan-associated lipoprotein
MKNVGVFICGLMAAAFLGACANQNVVVTTTSSGGLNSVYFDYDQSFIRQDAVATLQGNASYVKGNSSHVVIEGSCDNRGTNEYNLALGQRRSDAAKAYLANLGVDGSRLTTVSFGEEKPVCFENNESCWQRNRRADFRKR